MRCLEIQECEADIMLAMLHCCMKISCNDHVEICRSLVVNSVCWGNRWCALFGISTAISSSSVLAGDMVTMVTVVP